MSLMATAEWWLSNCKHICLPNYARMRLLKRLRGNLTVHTPLSVHVMTNCRTLNRINLYINHEYSSYNICTYVYSM